MKYERNVQIAEGQSEENSPAVKVIMTIDQKELEAPYNEYLNRIKRSRKFNGFRPGKVPDYIVEGKYGKEATNYVVTAMVESNIRDIAKEHGDKVLFRPVFYPFKKPDVINDAATGDMVFEVIYFRKIDDASTVTVESLQAKVIHRLSSTNHTAAALKIQSDDQKLIDASADESATPDNN